jgi:pyruvate/2-oxoglutarate/acetoin dehydrogenase E1 component
MGFGAEIAARVSEHAIDALDAPVVRVAAKDTFVPNAPNLEAAALPSVDDLRRAVERVMAW